MSKRVVELLAKMTRKWDDEDILLEWGFSQDEISFIMDGPEGELGKRRELLAKQFVVYTEALGMMLEEPSYDEEAFMDLVFKINFFTELILQIK